MLRFYAYFQEAVHEKAEEQYRIRHYIILFYLEDDTIQVNEPRQENSGIPQGKQCHELPFLVDGVLGYAPFQKLNLSAS